MEPAAPAFFLSQMIADSTLCSLAGLSWTFLPCSQYWNVFEEKQQLTNQLYFATDALHH